MNTSQPDLSPAFTRLTPAKSPWLGAFAGLLACLVLAPPQLRAELPPITLFSFPSDFFPSGSLLQARDGCLYGTTQNGGPYRFGMVFRMSPDGSVANIYSFTGGTNGANPYAGLIQAKNGALYGTTVSGGANQAGTVFRLTTNGVLTTLYSFTGGADGANPYAGLIQASDGSLYGATTRGGPSGSGTIFKITSLGTFSTLHSFSGGDGAFPFGSLVQGTDGFLYGTTLRGGAGNGSQYEFGTVFRLSLQGAFTTLHSFSGGDGAYPAAALIRARDGNLYGTAAAATADGSTPVSNGTIFRISPSGIFSVVYTFTGDADGANPYGALFQASDGYLYGTTASGANTNGTLFRFTTSGAFTNLAAFTGANGSQPYGGLVQGIDGNLYGTTTQGGTADGGTIFRYNISAPPFVLVHPLSQSATNRTAVSFSVLAGGSAPLSYRWLKNGAPLADSAVLSGATTCTLTLSDVAATDAGTYALLVTNSYGQAISSNASLAVTVLRPTQALLSPLPNARCSNSVLTVTGKASGPLGVNAVYYQLNNAGWNLAQSTNGWAKWTAQLALTQGTNTIQTYAVDSGGRASVTNTLKVFYVVNAPLTVQTTGRGTVTPNCASQLLELGRSYTLQAVPARGFVFTNWTGSITSRTPRLTFLMESNLTFTANFVDVTRPVTVLLSPRPNQRLTNALFTLSGRAIDNDAVASIFYQLNHSGWNLAQTTNGWTNWTADITLSPGTNVIQACAVDNTGLISLTNSPKCFYVVPAPLTVQTNGRGAVMPNYTGKLLELGRSYTLLATPAPGFVFSNWTGGNVSTKSTRLTFLMQSNLTFTANFTDVARPVLTLLSPRPGQRTTNALFTVSGRASDNGAVASVFYQLNNAGWSEAQTTNRWANWTANVSLNAGTNILQVYALDTAGNASLTNRVNLIRLP